MYYMESRKKKRLGDMLIEAQVITEEQLMIALEKKKWGRSWARLW